MYKVIFPLEDTTIRSISPTQSEGVDQILEISKNGQGDPFNIVDDVQYYGETYNSRILMKFRLSDISSLNISSSCEFYLSLTATEANSIPTSYDIFAYPISGSWTPGRGFQHNLPILEDGASWIYRHSKLNGVMWPTQSYSPNVTGSFGAIPGGANWYTSSFASQSFYFSSPDINMNITGIVKSWLSGSFQNDGLIIKLSDYDEQSSFIFDSIKFFSSQTHTVYVPKLHVYWDDVVLSGTGSFTEISSDSNLIYVKNLRETYTRSDKPILRLGGRVMYPVQTYATSSNYLVRNRLPINSYFEIQDSITYEKVVPSNIIGTKVSCDSNGNYIKLDMSSLMPERFYKLIFKCEFPDGSVINIDNNYEFRVTVI